MQARICFTLGVFPVRDSSTEAPVSLLNWRRPVDFAVAKACEIGYVSRKYEAPSSNSWNYHVHRSPRSALNCCDRHRQQKTTHDKSNSCSMREPRTRLFVAGEVSSGRGLPPRLIRSIQRSVQTVIPDQCFNFPVAETPRARNTYSLCGDGRPTT